MDLKARTTYLGVMQARYRKARSRKEKSDLLDEMVSATGMNRNYLIQKLRRPVERKKRSRERSNGYGPEVDRILAKTAQAQQGICAERLAGYLLETAENLAQHGQLYLDDHLREQLERISVSTIRRRLKSTRKAKLRAQSTGAPNSLQRQIPIRRIPWNVDLPGHCEVDLVHHGGSDPKGQFGYTLQVVDVATGWSGRRAILGRSYVVVADALHAIFEQFPFPVVQLHVDNGSEFLNHLLLMFLEQFYPTIELLRSTPSKPNDNRFVEQKNATLVRHYINNQRLDTVTQIRYLNSIYDHLGQCYNLWQPVFHQIDKHHIPATADRSAYTQRVHDRPVPPLVRLISTNSLNPEMVQALRSQQHAFDLFAAQDQIRSMFRHLFAYPCAKPDTPENVFQTLANPDLFPAAFVALDLITTDDLIPFPSLPVPVFT